MLSILVPTKVLKPYVWSLNAVHIYVTYKTTNKYEPELALVDTPNTKPEKVGINCK
jgi:hypothetical protein